MSICHPVFAFLRSLHHALAGLISDEDQVGLSQSMPEVTDESSWQLFQHMTSHIMKQEPADSPSSAALASRIAKYSYGSPSPNTKRQRVSTVKVETPTRSPRRNITTPVSPFKPSSSGIVRSPHFTAPTQPNSVSQATRVEPGTRPTQVEDDLESIDGDSVPDLNADQSVFGTSRPNVPVRQSEEEEEEEDEESDGLGDLVSSSSDEEEEGMGIGPGPSNTQQTRIRARRAGRGAISAPEEITSGRKRRKSRRAIDAEEAGTRRKGAKKGKKPRAYAGPEVYEHLRPLPDLLAPGLDGELQFSVGRTRADIKVVFCGIKYVFSAWLVLIRLIS